MSQNFSLLKITITLTDSDIVRENSWREKTKRKWKMQTEEKQKPSNPTVFCVLYSSSNRNSSISLSNKSAKAYRLISYSMHICLLFVTCLEMTCDSWIFSLLLAFTGLVSLKSVKNKKKDMKKIECALHWIHSYYWNISILKTDKLHESF